MTKTNWSNVAISGVDENLFSLLPEVNAQHLANPHTVLDDSGMPVTLAFGTTNDSPQLIGDRVYVIRDGKASIALSYPPHAPECIDYLGAGAAIAKTPETTSAGASYFAFLPAGSAAEDTAWMTWAVSADGERWAFVAQDGASLTLDPRESLRLIRLEDSGSKINGQSRFWHPAMFYDPSSGFFHLVFGYCGLNGIRATWWAMRFEERNPYGLGALWRRTSEDAGSMIYANQVVGRIPVDDAWSFAAGFPEDATDPMDLVPLYDDAGALESILFFYAPAAGIFAQPTRVAWVKLSTQGLPLASGDLDTSPVFGSGKWSACADSPSGTYIGAYQDGFQEDGRPRLRGSISVSQGPCVAADRFGMNRQALLGLELTLN